MPKVFHEVGAAKVGRSVFDLSYEKKMTCDMGLLIPVLHDEMVPGDVFNIGYSYVVRFQPLVAPILHQVDVTANYFFVPYRLLWDDWENFITGGEDGTFVAEIPTWPTDSSRWNDFTSLWDYMGFPILIEPSDAMPCAFPLRAYNLIFREYYRDEDLDTDEAAAAVGLQPYTDITVNSYLRTKRWRKDYFTSARPFREKGTPPIVPTLVDPKVYANFSNPWDPSAIVDSDYFNGITLSNGDQLPASADPLYVSNLPGGASDENFIMQVNPATAGIDLHVMREAIQTLRWMERSARAGSRYVESLRAHFGVNPRDERLQRPEYIGGFRNGIIFSEVLQTSESVSDNPSTGVGNTAQGNLAGHGISASQGYIGSYRAVEHGIIMGIMCVEPKSCYSQGINRQWLRRTKFDFYWPEFAHLSEQAILNAEIYAQDTATAGTAVNNGVFGYQGIYDEMRVKHDLYTTAMRTNYSYWHLGRIFTELPVLNNQFIREHGLANGGVRDDIMAVPSEHQMVVSWGNHIRAVRPLPSIGEPGFMDHI